VAASHYPGYTHMESFQYLILVRMLLVIVMLTFVNATPAMLSFVSLRYRYRGMMKFKF